jgi:hypothetical protein
LLNIRVDKQRHTYIVLGQPRASRPDLVLLTTHIEAAFRRQLLPFFRHEATVRWPHSCGDVKHFIGDRHFEVHVCAHDLLDGLEVAILNMAAIFPQMERNAVGACLLRDIGGLGRSRVARTAHLTQRRYMVNIDTK